MISTPLLFSVDVDRLSKYKNNGMGSGLGVDANQPADLSSDERLLLALLDTNLLKHKRLPAEQKIVSSGEEFEEAYVVVNGEVRATRGDQTFFLGPGAVLGVAEGLVSLPSRYTLMAQTDLLVKVIPFHKVDYIVHQLPPEFKSILVTIIKRNLTVKSIEHHYA
jgi:CRP-like cAMP-binding protein